MGLKDYPLEKIRAAFLEHVKTSKEFPALSEIIELIEAGGRLKETGALPVYVPPPNPNDWKQKTPAEKAEFTRFMDKLLGRAPSTESV
jgi:hypothetical protein